mgnify:FL=1
MNRFAAAKEPEVVQADIPDLDAVQKVIQDMKDQLMYSLENCDALLRQLKDPNNTRINHIERSNYIDFEDIDYLIQDFRKREFGSESSPFMRDLAELKAFKENLDAYDSDTFIEKLDKSKPFGHCAMCDEVRNYHVDTNCCVKCVDSACGDF